MDPAYNPTGAPSRARLLHNRGAAQPGFFDDVTTAAGVEVDGIAGTHEGDFPFAPRFADLDRDGWPDLALASDFGESALFWNDGDGTFTDGSAALPNMVENGMGSAIGDYDGDGLLDWFITAIYDPSPECAANTPRPWSCTGNRLYRNLGNRQFSDATDTHGVRNGYWGWGAAFWDYDNDADLDLVMVNGQDFPFPKSALETQMIVPFITDPMRLWRNDGAGAWPEVSSAEWLTDTGQGKGIATLDYDNDGDLDLFVVNNASHPRLYRNDGGNANSWLRVKVEGSTSNRDAIGARLELEAVEGGPVQTREIDAGTHFLGQSELTAHFGLGPNAGPVHRLKVEWPKSGRRLVLADVPPNATLLLVEPPPPGGCGLLGLEPLAALLLWWTRRPRPA
jgi:hypothetical protein